MNRLAIGFLDSGVGGFSVVKEVKSLLRGENIEYFADHAHQPYGQREQKEIKYYVFQIINFLLKKGIKACIIACNTATAASLDEAKKEFAIPIIGVIENGAKAAVKATNSGKIGLIGSEFLVNSNAYNKEIEKYAVNSHFEIFANPCPQLALCVESGQFNSREAYQLAKKYLIPIKEKNVDTLILGCTHYPFLQKLISDIMGSNVALINPAYNTAVNLKSILKEKDLLNIDDAYCEENYYTTGNTDNIKKAYKLIFNSSNVNVRHVNLLEYNGEIQ